jgi:type VI protein secretion system component Hcp
MRLTEWLDTDTRGGISQPLEEQMIRNLLCLFVLASAAAACGTAEPEATGDSASDPTVNALEASGQVEFFVKIAGANGAAFRGETTNAQFLGSIPAIRYYSDVNRGSSGGTHCTAFRFTKVAAGASPQLVAAVASGETLQGVHFSFVRSNGFVWQKVDLTGVRLSMVEQAVSPPDDLSAPVILEEATLLPVSTATVTLTSVPQNPDGTAGAAIVSTFSCVK